MFPTRYYPNRMFAPRYFPKVGATGTFTALDPPLYAMLVTDGGTSAVLVTDGGVRAALVTDGGVSAALV